MLQNGNEWYWNLNLHRDQLSLVNSSIGNGTDLPISSALYTSAVLNDNGICVGMRNVHLKGENQNFHRLKGIPNCCPNRNVVGQRNKQIWATAYDRMKFSALTDPSMTIRSNTVLIEPQDFHDMEIDPCSTNEMSAGASPFHLFGDSAPLSLIRLGEHPVYHTSIIHNQLVPPTIQMHYSKSCADINTSELFNYPNQSCFNEMYGSNPNISHRTRSCVSFTTSTHSNPSYMTFSDEKDENTSQSDCITPPKKKWMRNYMQSKPLLIYHCFSHLI